MRNAIRVLLFCLAFPAFARVSFNKVELRTNVQGLTQGQTGTLVVERDAIRFVAGAGDSLSLPASAVKTIVYSRVSGRRCKAALFPAVLFPPTLALLLSKGRKHYVELAFDDGQERIGAVEFKLHKSNYRGALRALEQVTGLALLYEQEGIRDSRQSVAARSAGKSGSPNPALPRLPAREP